MTVPTAIENLQKVAKLEGWDESPMATLLQQYNNSNPEVQQGIELYLNKPAEEAQEYLRIHALRPAAFWEACKATNDVSMREYVDTRRLAKSIRKNIYQGKKHAKS